MRFFLIILLLGWIHTSGQHFRTQQVLSQTDFNGEKIVDAQRDTSGYLWIATDSSVWRFDGQFLDSVHLTATDLEITALYIDALTGVHIGSVNGEVYRFQKGTFELIYSDSTRGAISEIIPFHNRLSWIHQTGWIVVDEREPFYSGYDFIYSAASRNNTLFIGTDFGLTSLNLETANSEIVNYPSYRKPHIVTSVNSADGSLWTGHYDGSFAEIQSNGQSIVKNSYKSAIRTIEVTGEMVWLGTHTDGLFAYSREIDSLFSIPEIEDKRILQLHLDREKLLWAISEKGIYKIDPYVEQFKFDYKNAQALLVLNHEFWIASDRGLQLWNPVTGVRIIEKQERVVSLESDLQRVYAGTFGNGLRIYDRVGNLLQNIGEDQGLRNGNIMDIALSKDRIFAATLGGVYSAEHGALQFEEVGLGTSFIYSVEWVSDELWIGTDGNGLIRWNPVSDSSQTYLPDESIIAVAYSGSDIIAGTADNDVFRIENHRATKLNCNIPLDESITGVIFLNATDILIRTDRRIYIYNLQNSRLQNLSKYDSFWKIPTDINSAFSDRNGRFWIAGEGEVTEIHREKVFCLHHPLFEIGQSMYNGVHTLRDNTQLGPDQNTLQFRLSSLSFSMDCEHIFEYRLRGLSDQWTSTRDFNVLYPALPSGEYVFELRRPDQSEIRSIRFNILAPWYLQWWFYTVAVVVLALFTWAMVKRRERLLMMRNKREREEIRVQFELLKNQVNPHFLFNSFNTLTDLVERKSDDAVPYIEKLSDLFRNILAYRKKEFITVGEDLIIAENYIDLQLHRFGKGLEVRVEVPDTVKESFIPPLTLQLLLENALKHNMVSEKSPLSIHISADSKYLYVSNNRNPKRSFNEKPGTGYGLSSIITRYRFFTQESVEVVENHERFEVVLPLIINPNPRT